MIQLPTTIGKQGFLPVTWAFLAGNIWYSICAKAPEKSNGFQGVPTGRLNVGFKALVAQSGLNGSSSNTRYPGQTALMVLWACHLEDDPVQRSPPWFGKSTVSDPRTVSSPFVDSNSCRILPDFLFGEANLKLLSNGSPLGLPWAQPSGAGTGALRHL